MIPPPVRPKFAAIGLALLASLLVGEAMALGQGLDLPPRPVGSSGGVAFARSLVGLSLADRERAIIDEVLKGNVPGPSRQLSAIDLTDGPTTLRFQATSDYLAVGSDDDYFYTPLSPIGAQTLADRLGCTLPTSKMVDAIYAAADVKLDPSPIAPTPAMTSVPVFLDHTRTIVESRRGRPPGGLVAGHKKDVVISKKGFANPGKVAIYGWHRAVGKPIQPLYTGHTDQWVDYSHGIRLVPRRMVAHGTPSTIEVVLADPRLAPLLSDEGVMRQTRYPTAPALPGNFEVFKLDRGVRVAIDRPPLVPADRPVLLAFYALANGNTIEQTAGKTLRPGDDWHFDLQQIAAQTEFLRRANPDRTLVVAYLENDLRSWPAWRKAQGDPAIAPIVDAVRSKFDPTSTRVVLSGHSGGGSLIFGWINQVEAIPEAIERIAFLDANYAYQTDRHRDKLVAWLKTSDRHYLSILAYNDALALLDGKPFVSEAGGTWGKSHLMRADLDPFLTFRETLDPPRKRFEALGGRVAFALTENPDRKILHTVQVERNGFIEAMLSGTSLGGVGYTYLGERAYQAFIRRD